jgi:C1A family cysteine protease
MKTRKHLLFSVILLVALLLVSFPNYISAGNPQSTGLKEPTASQTDWIKKNFPVIQDIRPNKLAIERINTEREARGLKKVSPSEFDLAPLLLENSFSASGTSTMTTADLAAVLPGSADNSLLPAFPPIRSQGGIGSCAAWATSYYQFTFETNQALGRTASNGDNSVIFSPKWTYDMINGGSDSGSYFSDAYALEIKNSVASWADFPYDNNYLAWSLNPTAWSNAINYRPLTWGQISNSNPDLLISDIKTQLANGHVLVIGTFVFSWVKSTLKDDPSTNLDDAFVNQYIATYMKNNNQGGHAMTVVGYNDNLWCDLNGNGIVDAGEKGAFKIANSWGTGDWNSGYRWVAYDALRTTSNTSAYGSWPTADRASSGVFWTGNIFSLTVAPYTPTVLAEVTLNSAKRGEAAISLGLGTSPSTIPSSTWTSQALNYSGGSYAFDGSNTACDCIFFFDFSDLAKSASGINRWFVSVTDRTAGSPTTISSFRLFKNGVPVATSTNTPVSVDGSQSYVWLDYVLNPANTPPNASIIASPTSGNLPLNVVFDGTGSIDPDGQIVSYSWSFGDSSNETGATTNHTFLSAGQYTATLTVVDDKGAKGTASTQITVVDPNLLNAPAIISASVSNTIVALKWIDNSVNQTGFYIERGVKIKTRYIYTRIGQVSANSTAFNDSPGSGTYYYRVQAFNANGASNYSNSVSAKVR